MDTLKLRRIAIDTYRENVAFLHRDCPHYRSEGFQALNKVEILAGQNAMPVLAVLNVVDDGAIVGPDELGLSEHCLLYTSPSPRDRTRSRMPSSA